MTYGAYREDRDRLERFAERYEDERAAEAARRNEPEINRLVKLAAVLAIGLLMWFVFGRIGGRPF
jgi:hypothetical protein